MGDFGLEFKRVQPGRVLARVWMPNLNCYGSPVGWLTARDSGWVVAEAPMTITASGDSLSGDFYQPTLKFTVGRTDSLPPEPPLPSIPAGPEAAWSYRGRGPFWASPVVADGIAFVGDTTGRFHAVRAADGKAEWTFDAGTPLFGAALVADRAVYVLGDDGRLFKLDRRTGEAMWSVALAAPNAPRVLPSNEAFDWDFASAAPVLHGRTLYVGTADGVLHAVNAESGATAWRFRTNGKIRASALVNGAHVYVGSLDHFVYALDRASGRLEWKFDTGSPVTSAPALAPHRIVVGTRDQSTLFALDADDGHVVWKVYLWLSWVESTPRTVNGRVYVGSSDSRRIRVLEPGSGGIIWSAQVWGWTWGTPLVAGDRVYYATAGAHQYFIHHSASLGALDRRTGEIVWRRPVALADGAFLSGYANSLAYADGKVLAAGLDGTLVAVPVE